MSATTSPTFFRSNLVSSGGVVGQQPQSHHPPPLTNAQPQQQIHLPKIVHPASRSAADPTILQVNARAVSRTSSLGEMADKMDQPSSYNHGALMSSRRYQPNDAFENTFTRSKKFENDQFQSASSSNWNSYNVPEGVKAVYTPDLNKISMPVFGSRPASKAGSVNFTSRSNASFSSPPTQDQAKVDVDEYYKIIREKVKSNFHETRTKFRHADPDGKGSVSKEAFAHILAAILGPSKSLSHQVYLKLLDKLGLKNRPTIRYEDFVECFNENKGEATDWIDPVRTNSNNQFQAPVNRKATQVFVILKEKAHLKTSDMVHLVPEIIGGSASKIFKPELLSAINGMGIKMESEEFEKLWKKFDLENMGMVKSDVFLKRLGHQKSESLNADSFNSSLEELGLEEPSTTSIPYAVLPEIKRKTPRQTKKGSAKVNPIEKWMKKRFREGFGKMKESFEELDLQKTGEVRRDQFLNVLRQHGLKLETNLLDAFLERCNVKLAKNSTLVSYVTFLERFQNRSNKGLAYRVITSGDFENEDKDISVIGLAERKILTLFQNDFLGLLQTFRKIDRAKTNTLSVQEFRAAIESQFSIEISDAEFEHFMREVPRDSNDRVKYLEFMTKFDTDASSTLFDAQSTKPDDYHPKLIKKREYDPILEEDEESEPPATHGSLVNMKKMNCRTREELYDIIKDHVRNRYKQVEKTWSEIDILNTNEMNKDMMYTLFRRLKIKPEINRDEIDFLWNDFILKDNKKLEYWQFVRHFGYSKKSAAYQNAKMAPPKKGDNDMMLTSNKLGRDSILIRGSVQTKLILLYNSLRRSFAEMDPYYTNYLLRDEFEETLKEFCPELNQQEMEYICSKYENKSDGRINYVEFLVPYASKRSKEIPPDNLKNTDESPSSRLDMNDPLILKLRMRLTEHYRQLRKLFKQNDYKQTGFVTVTAFRDTLRSTNVELNEDDMYSLMRRLDKDVTGLINYNKFLNEMIKP